MTYRSIIRSCWWINLANACLCAWALGNSEELFFLVPIVLSVGYCLSSMEDA